MGFMKRTKQLWERQRALAVRYEISEKVLLHMDALLANEDRYVTARDSYLAEITRIREWIDYKVHFHATRDPVRHAAFKEYDQALRGDFIRFQIANEKALQAPRARGYMDYVTACAPSAPDLVSDLMIGIPEGMYSMIRCSRSCLNST